VSKVFHSLPQVQNHLCSLRGAPAAERAADTRGFGRDGLLVFLKHALWNDERILSDRTHIAKFYAIRMRYGHLSIT
jgi:hypothetical protein